jgi:hypothetical protein
MSSEDFDQDLSILAQEERRLFSGVMYKKASYA